MFSQMPETIISSHLQSGERLLWSGKPAQGIRFRKQDIFMIPFSLMWGGFAIFWEVMALSTVFKGKATGDFPAVAIFFPLWGVPFVLIGLYLIFGRFIFDAKKRASTFYGVTGQRIIIVSGLFSQTIKSLNLRTLTDISMDQKNDGSGTITFGATNPMTGFFGRSSWPGAYQSLSPAFDMIENASEVYRVITEAQKEV
jgi:hypothetical protein